MSRLAIVGFGCSDDAPRFASTAPHTHEHIPFIGGCLSSHREGEFAETKLKVSFTLLIRRLAEDAIARLHHARKRTLRSQHVNVHTATRCIFTPTRKGLFWVWINIKVGATIPCAATGEKYALSGAVRVEV